jgi:hypothetical protein
LTPEQKRTELKRHRAILLATLDYMEQHLGGSFVCDGYDPLTEYYQQQKIQTEKYFNQGRLDRLQQRLKSLTKGLQNRNTLNFIAYIKEKTGYDIDIYEDLRKRVAAIIAQNEIRSQRELNDIGTMLHHFDETSENEEKVEKLKLLLTDYCKRANNGFRKKKIGYSEVISRVRKEGIEEVTVRFSNGPKRKHFVEQEATSPDGKRRLRVVQWSDGKHASTYVAVEFPTASGAVYGLSGICPDVKAWWKDNSTIVIETRSNYTAQSQNKEVRSFDDVIGIEYVEC